MQKINEKIIQDVTNQLVKYQIFQGISSYKYHDSDPALLLIDPDSLSVILFSLVDCISKSIQDY